ncbi:MAG: alpha/beta hydrolase [Proteobacteria bacterium]|jgi:pimeloyl-ACP methyl ester carboxylesterase|nr:alpha/beta hydrolase [Pseudomonadota bacterium]
MMRTCHTFNGPDGDFNYIDWGGSGPLVHLAHATGFCAGAYTPIAETLGRRLRVLGMDDRGHGKTTAEANPRKLKNWNGFAEDLAHFFKHLQEPVIAMGHSRGAVASLLVAVKRPDLIRALILIDPTILPFSWMWWWYLAKKTGFASRVPIAARAARRNPFWPDRETLLNAYRAKHPFRSWANGFLEGYIADGTKTSETGGIRLCCTPEWESRCFSVCSHDIWRYIPRLQLPTLLLYGADSDTFLPPAVKRFQAKVPHAVIRRFENTSHFVPMERPDDTATVIFRFLEEEEILPGTGSR